jgi:hypothetical protein
MFSTYVDQHRLAQALEEAQHLAHVNHIQRGRWLLLPLQLLTTMAMRVGWWIQALNR